ncbi:type VI secretion system baseplate subunit TssG [Yersinia mollaretii]|uniref:type VI secretion system baseplate subunit TssG n=1 Tax=Yersinia mollaretii TaxID=33060 RepID=UPI0005E3C618|nr:type VI secretion system baseplate subunit TssG [Yersinia mollaretii]MDA5527565.1 type VI secretion system baseplate subunit TssG [Yersinia mollaretii]MDR7875102.1 type VI secretion system baseplate subunit TssG [Yersinia mollaretii]PHZ32574.1 type VI secretion system baseplate subunit TssG [Yersinia mollaretii]WQC74819.1 type VI secretion system baseplate subunit TssG [Yersinia mollaretii]CND99650.1 type VI secretion protein [Yersinia mollaretii]
MDVKPLYSRHSFFQQVRVMLQKLSRQKKLPPAEILTDHLRFISPLSLDAGHGEIGDVSLTQDQQWQVEVFAYGMTGAIGALPTAYTEWLIDRYYRYGDTAGKAFLDIFNHRLQSLRFLSWQKYHYYAASEYIDSPPLSQAIRALAGVLQQSAEFQQEKFAGLLVHPVRSLVNLEIWLQRHFAVPAQITPFTGSWKWVASELCCRLGHRQQDLGSAPMLGSVCRDIQSNFTLTLGPIKRDDANLFLPEGRHYHPLWHQIENYVGIGLDFEIDLLIDNEQSTTAVLGLGILGLDICLAQRYPAVYHKVRLPVLDR